MQDRNEIADRRSGPNGTEVPFSSNSIQLKRLDWIVVGIICAVFFLTTPGLWARFEKFTPGTNYRLPYRLSSDYGLYSRYCRQACSQYDTLVVGDSVIWGHYVSADNTLSHYLNQCVDSDRFANMGVDGIHPAALSGLLRYYGRDIMGKNVILQLNPLWMSSAKHDLQTSKEFRFNHPKLVPQFIPHIPCYKEKSPKRISIAVQRWSSFFTWISHLKIAYFDNMDLPTWTMEHPYENPMRTVATGLPDPADDTIEKAGSWKQRGMGRQDFQWVELQTSLQWQLFRRAIDLLKARQNTVFVLVGPFNEHMFSEQSRTTYRQMKEEIQTWLRTNEVAHYMPEALPSELYHDASHPSAEGYAMLAKQLFADESFRSALLRTDAPNR
ncbi:MAG: SGNH/GDSL hydrolase family protein [Phycisphaerales bacterium]|nr:MAG: SGNH/GDSL hydrolase family protein [Phycisphaerales bacterium]